MSVVRTLGVLVTIHLPRNQSTFAAPAKQVDRRTLIKAGAWAAPVLIMTAAAPAAASSHTVGPVPAAQLTITPGQLSTSAASAGPLNWTGGQILWNAPSSGGPDMASVSYTAVLTGPGGLSQTLYSGAANLAPGGTINLAALSYGSSSLANGDYRVTITAVSDGATSGMTNIATVATGTVRISALTGTKTSGTGANSTYNLAFSVTNAGTVAVTVSVALTSVDVSGPPSPGNFSPINIPAGGTVSYPISGTITASTTNNSGGKQIIATPTVPAGWTAQGLTKTFKGGDGSF